MNVAASIFSGGRRKGAGFGWWWHTPGDTLDKIDAEILERDTAIYLHATWRLLTDPVIPLDYADYAHDLAAKLSALGDAARYGVDPQPALVLVGELTSRLRDLAAKALGEADAAARSALLMRLSRHLVPIDYTTGDRFGQDPALGQSPFPVLDPVRSLLNAARSSTRRSSSPFPRCVPSTASCMR